MKKIKNISLIGIGAIGATYGGKLHDMNPDCLKVIVDRERYERYTNNGFNINGKLYNFNYVLPEEKVQPADLILVTVKYHDLGQAIDAMKHHVGQETIILPLLNGISSEEIIGKVYGMDKLLYGICVAIDAVRDGNNITYSNSGKIFFGQAQNMVYTKKVEAVKKLFEKAGIENVVPENMIHTLWWKFMVNVGINQTSAVLGAPYGVFQQVKEAQQFMESAMKEVITLSQSMGIGLQVNDIEEWYKVLATLSPEGKTSMLQDVEACRKTEVEMMAGTICELGREYHVDTPINEALFQMIRTLEQLY